MQRKKWMIAAAVILFMALPAQAQHIEFGAKVGLNTTKLTMNKELFSKKNQTGFFLGPTVKIGLPITGLGVAAAVLYDQRDAKLDETKVSQRSINIPVHLRYSVGVGRMASIYAFAGPQIGFNVGHKKFSLDSFDYQLKNTNLSVNLGLGVTLFKHLELGANYNIACGKTGEATLRSVTSDVTTSLRTHNNAWQILAAYYF